MATMLEERRASLGGQLGDVASVRHTISGWLRDWDLGGLVEDVELVASELITNAVLHAGGEIVVVLQRCGGGVRVVVRDGRPEAVPVLGTLPLLGRLGDDDVDQVTRSVFEGTTTGRGLLLVDAFADAWGVAVEPRSKEVWAELGTGRASGAEPVCGPAPAGPRGVPVRLRDVPARLVLLSAANMDDLLRELQTTSFEASAPTELAVLGERLVHETSAQREPLRSAARAALRQRTRRIDVDLDVPPGQVAVLRRFVSLTDQVEHFCRTGVLLSQPPTDEVTSFRRWYVEELDRQVRGQDPDPCPFPE